MNQLNLLPGMDCLPGQLDLPLGGNQVSAADLVNHADEIAVVSGERCRDCGHNARRDPPNTVWYVEHSTAYCAECWAER
jgi:hypothetical protein